MLQVQKVRLPMDEEIIVVYVEDEPSIATLLKSGLGLFGIKVDPHFLSAENLLEQFDAQDRDPFADAKILMFDIRLPGMNGVDLAGKLREKGEKRPFVLVSAWPAPTQEKLDEIGAVFLPKPFDFSDVVKTIQGLVWGDD